MTHDAPPRCDLAADLAGSCLIGTDEAGTLQAFKAIREQLFHPTIAAHNGRLLKTTGDGFLTELSSGRRQLVRSG